jgi:hypothetical protein
MDEFEQKEEKYQRKIMKEKLSVFFTD